MMPENQHETFTLYSMADFKAMDKIAKRYGFSSAYEYCYARNLLSQNPEPLSADYGYGAAYFESRRKNTVDRIKVAVAVALLAGMGVNNPLAKKPIEFKAYLSTNSPPRRQLTLVDKLDEA
jgi:hypothetical protein